VSGDLTEGLLRAVARGLPDDRLTALVPGFLACLGRVGAPSRPGPLAAALAAQVAHESVGFRYLREIWRPSAQQLKYEPPHPLAKKLGNVQKGDGFLYRGRGWIQLTGRNNYRRCGAALGLPLEAEPERVATPDVAWLAVSWFWNENSLARWCTVRDVDFETLTKKINGGLTGIQDRVSRWRSAKAFLGLS